MASDRQLDDELFRRLLKRERAARKEAEKLLEQKSAELYDVNQRLRALAEMLEQRVEERTAELESALLRAESGDRAKSTFLANMSHEIRTPLNGICGLARILKNKALDHDAMEQVRGIQISADSLLHVLNDILDFSKVEAGQLEIELVDFGLAQVIDSAFTVLQTRAAEKALRFDFIYPDADLPQVRGDPARLNQILLNLLSNAIKFTDEGEITLIARVVKRTANQINFQFSIRDTGVGMTPEVLEHIFEPFTQADSSISRRFGGSGLGLAICRDLIRLMGGTLCVESEPNKGTDFTIDLPCEVSQKAVQVSPNTQHDGPPLRVFLITQSDNFYLMCKTILAYGGLSLSRVHSAAEAVSRLGHARGVLLLDRSLELAYAPSVDPDLLEPLPDSMARILISELIPPSTVKSAVVLSYPLSRYKLLSTVLSLLDLRLPDYLFRKYDESDFDNIDLSGLRVLVAEDNTINQKVARMTIERFGATVDLAANGQEVLGLVDRFGYDLILMDIRMPVMNGVESCKRLRSKGIHTPIYALTADAMKGDRERFLEAGMNGYLSKPLVEADLAELLVNYRINAQEPLEDEVTDSGSVGSGSADELYGQAPDLLILDLDAFIELLDGSRSVALNLLQQFAASVDQAIFEAEAALANGDFETACSRFHQLAGTSATICAHQARAFFLSLECSLMEDPPNAELCVKRFPEAREALQRLCAEIRIADEQG